MIWTKRQENLHNFLQIRQKQQSKKNRRFIHDDIQASLAMIFFRSRWVWNSPRLKQEKRKEIASVEMRKISTFFPVLFPPPVDCRVLNIIFHVDRVSLSCRQNFNFASLLHFAMNFPHFPFSTFFFNSALKSTQNLLVFPSSPTFEMEKVISTWIPRKLKISRISPHNTHFLVYFPSANLSMGKHFLKPFDAQKKETVIESTTFNDGICRREKQWKKLLKTHWIKLLRKFLRFYLIGIKFYASSNIHLTSHRKTWKEEKKMLHVMRNWGSSVWFDPPFIIIFWL